MNGCFAKRSVLCSLLKYIYLSIWMSKSHFLRWLVTGIPSMNLIAWKFCDFQNIFFEHFLSDSYSSMHARITNMVGLIGLEPMTPALSRRCSNQLSYRPDGGPMARNFKFEISNLKLRRRRWWRLTDSNRWHSACKADALPTELNPLGMAECKVLMLDWCLFNGIEN